ncbi:YggT family protein [Agromyces sp. NPDC004153]
MSTGDLPHKYRTPWYLRVLRATTWLLYAWVVVGVVALILRVILLLFGANPASPFVDLVYRVSESYMAPFRDIFPTPEVVSGSYLDVSAIFAIIVYGLLAGLVSAAVEAIARSIARAEQRERDERQWSSAPQAGSGTVAQRQIPESPAPAPMASRVDGP